MAIASTMVESTRVALNNLLAAALADDEGLGQEFGEQDVVQLLAYYDSTRALELSLELSDGGALRALLLHQRKSHLVDKRRVALHTLLNMAATQRRLSNVVHEQEHTLLSLLANSTGADSILLSTLAPKVIGWPTLVSAASQALKNTQSADFQPVLNVAKLVPDAAKVPLVLEPNIIASWAMKLAASTVDSDDANKQIASILHTWTEISLQHTSDWLLEAPSIRHRGLAWVSLVHMAIGESVPFVLPLLALEQLDRLVSADNRRQQDAQLVKLALEHWIAQASDVPSPTKLADFIYNVLVRRELLEHVQLIVSLLLLDGLPLATTERLLERLFQSGKTINDADTWLELFDMLDHAPSLQLIIVQRHRPPLYVPMARRPAPIADNDASAQLAVLLSQQKQS
jgi:hypothetical protein